MTERAHWSGVTSLGRPQGICCLGKEEFVKKKQVVKMNV